MSGVATATRLETVYHIFEKRQVVFSGIPEFNIGDTIVDLQDPQPLDPIAVEEPTMSITMGVNKARRSYERSNHSRRSSRFVMHFGADVNCISGG